MCTSRAVASVEAATVTLNVSVTVRSSAVAEALADEADRLNDVSTVRTAYQYVAPSSTAVSVKDASVAAAITANGPAAASARRTS
jgi:hypothetical protein